MVEQAKRSGLPELGTGLAHYAEAAPEVQAAIVETIRDRLGDEEAGEALTTFARWAAQREEAARAKGSGSGPALFIFPAPQPSIAETAPATQGVVRRRMGPWPSPARAPEAAAPALSQSQPAEEAVSTRPAPEPIPALNCEAISTSPEPVSDEPAVPGAMFSQESARSDDDDRILSRVAPLDSARNFAQRKCFKKRPDGQEVLTTHFYRDNFWEWNGCHYARLPETRINDQIYAFLDRARTASGEGETVRFKPRPQDAEAILNQLIDGRLPRARRPVPAVVVLVGSSRQ
jgi:hypothetical protein